MAILDENRSVILDAAGNGTVKIGPASLNVRWQVTGASVQVTTNVKEPTANLYQGARGSFLGGTYTGSNDSTDLDVELSNSSIVCEWLGGDAGARATLFLRGTVSRS